MTQRPKNRPDHALANPHAPPTNREQNGASRAVSGRDEVDDPLVDSDFAGETVLVLFEEHDR